MAGDWIKFECSTPDKPEVHAIADQLGIDPDAVVGKLLRVWIWADQQTYEGKTAAANSNAPGVTLALLDRYAAVAGFGAALIAVGWLSECRGVLTFTNFDRHNGQTAKARALTAKRVAKSRAAKRNGGNVTPALPEKRREEKRREAVTPIVPKGDEYTAAFLHWWSLYPLKKNKRAASKAFAAASKRTTSDKLNQSAAAYAASEEGRSQYCPHASTWLNQGKYDDDPATWARNDAGHQTDGQAVRKF